MTGEQAQVEREVAVGETAPLLRVEVPQRVERAGVRLPELLPSGGQFDAGGIGAGGAALVGMRAQAAVKVDVPQAQCQPAQHDEQE